MSLKAFQFHNGSIKSSCADEVITCSVFVFQFHNGSIKSYLNLGRMATSIMGFNSTMVRLKANPIASIIALHSMFQFHNGSIKRTPSTPLTPPSTSFQFHNGSIKRLGGPFFSAPLDNLFQFHNGSIKSQTKGYGSNRHEKVSIPQWFD